MGSSSSVCSLLHGRGYKWLNKSKDAKTLVREQNSRWKHARNPKHSYIEMNFENYRLSCDHGMFGVTHYSDCKTVQSFLKLNFIRYVCSSSGTLTEQVTRNPRFSCESKLFALNLGGTGPGWRWMPLLGDTLCLHPLFISLLLPTFFFFYLPSIASPYQSVPPINPYRPDHWYSGLENRVSPSQQPVFKLLSLNINARMPQQANPKSMNLCIPATW